MLQTVKMKLYDFFRGRSHLVDLLSIMFGIGSWIAVNGMWVELPIMVNKLPEQWKLASYLSAIIQIANVAPILYTLANTFYKGRVNDSIVIHAMMFTGTISCLLLGFFWDSTSEVGGNKHSVALFVLTFFLSIVDCTSSVLFFPFIGLFKHIYLMPFFIGESFSGFLPGVLGLGQGAGSTTCENISRVDWKTGIAEYKYHKVYLQPKFSIEIFFFFLCGMMITSWLAYGLLQYLPVAQHERVSSEQESEYANETKHIHFETNSDSNNQSYALSESGSYPVENRRDQREEWKNGTFTPTHPMLSHLPLLLLQGWICFVSNGLLPAIQPYSCAPYGNDTFHLAVVLSTIASPLACVIAMFIPLPRGKGIYAQVIISTICGIYILIAAAESPNPPLVHHSAGKAIMVIIWIVKSGLISFTKVCIANRLRDEGSRPLFWFGVSTQAGSAIGAIISFILVGVANVFKSFHSCAYLNAH